MITKEEITKLSELARIKLTEGEKRELQNDMGAILDYFKKLQALETNNSEDAKCADEFSVTSSLNEFREDENPNQEGEFSENLLRQTPNKENGYLKVKKIL